MVAGTAPKQTRIDRTVYSVTRDLQASTGTAADVLANVPSVAVDVDVEAVLGLFASTFIS